MMKTVLFILLAIGAIQPVAFQPESHGTVESSLGATSPDDHDFHVSKCLVEYNEGEQALQMSLHIFIDDLEEALRYQGKDELFLCTKKENEQAEQYVYRYLQQHFRFEVNGESQEYTFIGKEISEDLMAVWCYLEITGVSRLEALKVHNSILMDLYDDQKNLVSITGPGGKRGLLLFQKGDTAKEAEF